MQHLMCQCSTLTHLNPHTTELLQHSLLQCNSYYKEWNTKFGPTHGRQSDVMTQERR